MEIAGRSHKVQFPRAPLRYYLLKVIRGGRRIEILDAHLTFIGHLRLKLAYAAYEHWAHYNLEKLSVPANSLHNLHEALTHYAGTDLILKLFVELESLHS
jgi:hypothetical protein